MYIDVTMSAVQHTQPLSHFAIAATLLTVLAIARAKYKFAKLYLNRLLARRRSFLQLTGIMLLMAIGFGLLLGISTLSVAVGIGSAAIFFIIAVILLAIDAIKG
jgi:hypothetical protein